jgi:hypothetical protein
MRGIERLEKRFDDAAKGFVSIAIHNLLADRVKDLEADAKQARLDAEANVEKARADAAAALSSVRTELDNAKKTRAQTWTAIGLLFAGGVVALIWDIFTKGLGLS